MHEQSVARVIMNPWEEEILVALAWHLRVLSVEQIARTWWQGQATAKRRATDAIKARQKNGWLHVRELLSRPTSPLGGPLVSWTPNHRAPNFDKLSRLLHRRARTAARKIRVVTATRKTRELYGVAGPGHRPKLTQLSHELFVAEIFIRYRANGLDVDRQWIGEDQFPKSWPVRSRPDVLLRNQDDKIVRAVEYGGAYTVHRLSKLHAALRSIPLAYEIW